MDNQDVVSYTIEQNTSKSKHPVKFDIGLSNGGDPTLAAITRMQEGWDKQEIDHQIVTKSDVVSAFDVASYIMGKISRCTTMKLQKLLYYCQAWYLVWNERPLFSERIEAWANGPVIRELYQFHKGLYFIGIGDIPLGNPDRLTENQKCDIDSVLDAYGGKSSQWLIDQTHRETPWQNARRGLAPSDRGHVEISLQEMADYYSSLYGQKQAEG